MEAATREGWTNLYLNYDEGKWWICCNKAQVPLEKALADLVAACPGAKAKLTELDNQPF